MPPISSYAIVMYAALLHAIEALIVMTTGSADGSIGIHALLAAVPDHQTLGVMLLMSSAAALAVLCRSRHLPPSLTVILLVPQQAALLITGLSAWFAAWMGSYADGIARSSAFITADQLPRGMCSLLHMTAIYSIAVFCDRGRRRH